MKSLGKTLKETRELRTLTLREVEKVTGISNAYLSQLENDKIKNPSASILYKLSSILKIELNTLLAAAGVIEKSSTESDKLLNSIAFSSENLTREEEQALLDYLKYIRYHKKNGGSP